MSTIDLTTDSLADRPLADVITGRGKELPVGATVAAARALFRSDSVQLIPLLDDGGAYVASVTREAIAAAGDEDALAPLATADVPTATASTLLRDGLAALGAQGGQRLVVLGDDGLSYVGLVCVRSDGTRLCVDAECHASPDAAVPRVVP